MLMLGLVPASAQQQRDVRVVNTFRPHWYVTLNPIGGQYTLGEVDFESLTSWNMQATVGYEFNPIIGARLSVNGWTSKAGTDETFKSDGSQMTPRMTWKWNYVAPSVDVTVNLSNIIMGNYNPKRPFILGAFVGLGANIGWDNGDAWSHYDNIYVNKGTTYDYARGFEPFRYIWSAKEKAYPGGEPGQTVKVKDGDTQTLLNVRFGLTGDIRLSDRFSVNLELQANTLSDRYNSKRAGNTDWYFNALAGLRMNLGKTYTSKTVCAKKDEPKVIERVVERIVEKPVPCPETKPAPEPQKIAETNFGPLRRDVFFTISSTKVDPSEEYKIRELGSYMQQNANAKIQITGYADKGTGNAKGNMSLSQRRAAIVADKLANEYGIDRSRMTIDYKGDTVQPFEEDVKNRVSICIAQ